MAVYIILSPSGVLTHGSIYNAELNGMNMPCEHMVVYTMLSEWGIHT